MMRMKIYKLLKTISLAIFILLIFLVFWISVLKNAFYIPVSAMFYQCKNPYISAYATSDSNVLTTLNKKDYCVDLAITFKNSLHKRDSGKNYQFILLDFDKLHKVRLGSKHSFFKDPSPRNYLVVQKNAGVFYMDFLENFEFDSKRSTQQIQYIQPKLRLYDSNLNTILFED
ncbi:hypothetical protein [Acinetobacter gyllenbergii]|uniref:hypothetical protein n=1 Tax=Acinetobacter gyllenbergii TaxID=134534 RepID=UPI003F559B09